MNLFSQRKGLKPARKALQVGEIDLIARNALWSVLWRYFELYDAEARGDFGYNFPYREQLDNFARAFWTRFLNEPLDTAPEFKKMIRQLRERFYGGDWNDVLDILEFTVQALPKKVVPPLIGHLNSTLAQTGCAYRILDDVIVENLSEAEVEAVEKAVELKEEDVSVHIRKALGFLADRKNPDFHNSIKESVLALEAAGRRFLGDPNVVFSLALPKIQQITGMHPCLKNALSSVYAYAGDEGGVRHANKENGKPVTLDEARLILVLASAASNYVITKRA